MTPLRVSDPIPQVVFLAPIITNPAPVGIDWRGMTLNGDLK